MLIKLQQFTPILKNFTHFEERNSNFTHCETTTSAHTKWQCRLLIMLSIRRQCIIFMDKLCRLQATRNTKRKNQASNFAKKREAVQKKGERSVILFLLLLLQ